METTGEMNWQLLIKIVSFSLVLPLRSPSFDSLFGSWKIDRRSRKNWLRSAARGLSFRRTTGVRRGQRGEERREGFRSSSGGDAVSILFVHANYSSSVTLLEIEGTGTPPSSVLPVPLAVPANLSRSFRVLFAHLLGPFSFLPARSSLPCPGGFLMDPDHAALCLPHRAHPPPV